MGLPMVAHLNLHLFIGLSFHDGVIAATPPVPVPKSPNISFGILNGVWLGSLNSAGLVGPTKPVHGSKGLPLVGRTNDAGFVVPHVALAQFDLMQPLTILMGGSQSMLGASAVKIPVRSLIWGEDVADTACCMPIPFAPMSINFGCNDPLFVPFDRVIAPNTILVGVSWADLFAMLIDLVIAALIEGLMMAGGALAKKGLKKVGGLGKKAAKKAAAKAAEEAAEEAGEKAVQKGARKAAKEAVDEGAKEAGDEAAARVARKQELAEALRKQKAKGNFADEVGPPKAKAGLDAAQDKARKEAQQQFRKDMGSKVAKEAKEKFQKESAEKVRKEAAEKARKEALDTRPDVDLFRGQKWRSSLDAVKGDYAEKVVTTVIKSGPVKLGVDAARGVTGI